MAIEYGYTGRILRVDLSSGRLSDVPTSLYSERFLGGRGISAKVYWDEVPPQTKPLDEANKIMVMTGPLCGFTGIGGSRFEISSKSPSLATPYFSSANFGGSWGAYLKFAGYDGIIVEGKSQEPVYLAIVDGKAELKDASHLWGKTTLETRAMLKELMGSATRVLATSPAGENMVRFATMLADDDASGGAGFGAVFGSKKLKAIAVGGNARPVAANPDQLREIAKYVRAMRGDTGATLYPDQLIDDPRNKRFACYGCISGCERRNFTTDDGLKGKFMCQSGRFYRTRAKRFYGQWNDAPFRATKACDHYGLDTDVIEPMIMWILRAFKAGVINEENTGIPIAKVGSVEFIETLCRKIAHREGLGALLAEGILKTAEKLGPDAVKAAGPYFNRKDEGSPGYDPRMFITSAVLWATSERPPRGHLHELSWVLVEFQRWVKKSPDAHLSPQAIRALAKRAWGGEIAGDFSTYEGKALAAKMIQDRQLAKDCLVLCDFTWPMLWTDITPDHVGDTAAESRILSAVTGKDIDEQAFYTHGEKVYNLQRAIQTREGHHGKEHDKLPDLYFDMPMLTDAWNDDCLAPGKDGEVISKKGWKLDRDKFAAMMDEFYQLRGWDVTSGLQTRERLDKLGLPEVAEGLAKDGLLGGGSGSRAGQG